MLAIRLLEESGGIGWWVWIVLLVFLVMVFLGWWVWKNGKLKKEEEPKHEEHVHAEPAVQAVAAPAKPDDLTELEGIGPKVAKLLEGIGITTFKQLAEADMAKLRTALDGAGYKYMEPAGWVEQAVLAAKSDKEGLAKLQSELKGAAAAPKFDWHENATHIMVRRIFIFWEIMRAIYAGMLGASSGAGDKFSSYQKVSNPPLWGL